MNKRDIAQELSFYSRREIFQILRASKSLKIYRKLTKEEKTLEEEVEDLEKE